ncbi:hypothetical protein BJ508DRAFT_315973 [Ascobolus immersus RN42]|uniref:Uncharacterized protein n=1 Tax=Ascobolus immersus RN42 TaxID=1160509 RepID=A0A3N4HCK4_ASCIM|nr:hypothetical protein BJ508DRAFT_315973 [Ascobolus immersus RN42]
MLIPSPLYTFLIRCTYVSTFSSAPISSDALFPFRNTRPARTRFTSSIESHPKNVTFTFYTPNISPPPSIPLLPRQEMYSYRATQYIPKRTILREQRRQRPRSTRQMWRIPPDIAVEVVVGEDAVCEGWFGAGCEVGCERSEEEGAGGEEEAGGHGGGMSLWWGGYTQLVKSTSQSHHQHPKSNISFVSPFISFMTLAVNTRRSVLLPLQRESPCQLRIDKPHAKCEIGGGDRKLGVGGLGGAQSAAPDKNSDVFVGVWRALRLAGWGGDVGREGAVLNVGRDLMGRIEVRRGWFGTVLEGKGTVGKAR